MAETATKSIIIQGETFVATQPYTAGHALTEAEARALNQLRNENLRNNFAAKVKASVEGAEGAIAKELLAGAFTKYDAEYSFAMPGAGGASRTMDPIEREARSLARTAIKAALNAKGRKLTDVPEGMTKDQWEEKLEASIDTVAQQPDVLKQAKANVANRKRVVDSVADTLDIAGLSGPADAEEEAEEEAGASTAA